MKKANLFFCAAILGAISTAVIILYLMRDSLAGIPLIDRFKAVDEDDYDEMDEYTFEDEDEEFDLPKDEKRKIRRGYIPLKFHSAQ